MKRILAIDGGGIKGVFPASFLASIEDVLGESVYKYFDLIAGTSTGGIIAVGLGLGLSAKEILEFYEELGSTVFSHSKISTLKWVLTSKYDQAVLRDALTSVVGDRRLGESKTRLLVPSLNLETGEVHIYKTAHHPRFETDYKESAVDVALATAAAPSYFPIHRSTTGTPLVDGGIWANNPIGMAVVEAIGVLDWKAESICVLSLGCTTQPVKMSFGHRLARGAGFWVRNAGDALELFMAAQSSASLGTAATLIGHKNIFRISPVVPRGRFGLDTYKEIASLKGLGSTEARKAITKLRPYFFQTPADLFTPCRTLKDYPSDTS